MLGKELGVEMSPFGIVGIYRDGQGIEFVANPSGSSGSRNVAVKNQMANGEWRILKDIN